MASVLIIFHVAPEYQELRHQDIHDIAILIERGTSHRHDALMRLRTRWRDFKDLALDVQSIARTRGPGPRDFSTQADDAIREGQTAGDQKPHGRGGGVPTAGCEPFEDARLRGRLVQVERLRIKFGGELFD